jgi:polyhydroxybutyrate depolymerase
MVTAVYHRSMTRPSCLSVLALALAGCGSGGGASPDAAVAREAAADHLVPDARPLPLIFGGARPVQLDVPPSYDPTRPTPLLLILHGYGASGTIQQTYFGFRDLAKRERVLVLAPNGTLDSTKSLFWNATDACCDFEGKQIDDVGYLTGLISEVAGAYNVDPKRIYAMGHSNGGFMAHRLACDRAQTFAAIVSVAGALPEAAAACQPKETLSVLQVHGDKDGSVLFGGSVIGPGTKAYPGAKATVARWASLNGCGADLVPSGESFDADALVAGDETTVARHACPTGLDAELWQIVGGAHVPIFTATFSQRAWQWLSEHPKR